MVSCAINPLDNHLERSSTVVLQHQIRTRLESASVGYRQISVTPQKKNV